MEAQDNWAVFRSASYFDLDRCSNWRSSLGIEIQGNTFAFTFALQNTAQILASVVCTMFANLYTTIYCFLEEVGWVRYAAFCLSLIIHIIPSSVPREGCAL